MSIAIVGSAQPKRLPPHLKNSRIATSRFRTVVGLLPRHFAMTNSTSSVVIVFGSASRP
jgi:hypothetical protein